VTVPSVAPIKKKGVTSPPLNPAPNVNPVKSILAKNHNILGFEKDSTIIGTPSLYFVLPMK
jgi:hypothetical protein